MAVDLPRVWTDGGELPAGMLLRNGDSLVIETTYTDGEVTDQRVTVERAGPILVDPEPYTSRLYIAREEST